MCELTSLVYSCPDVRIKKALSGDRTPIRQLYMQIESPHTNRIDIHEYFVAVAGGKIVGCAAIRRVRSGGYLYGRVVAPEWRRKGIGTALIAQRLTWLNGQGAKMAVGLVMFWNVSAFRKLGFLVTPRNQLPRQFLKLRDFQSERNRHCATLLMKL